MASMLCMLLCVACGDQSTPPVRTIVGNSQDSAIVADIRNPPPVLVPITPTRQDWQPERALCFIADLGGFFRDCNCSGEQRGGIAKIPDAALGAGVIHYVFVGWTLVEAPRRGTGSHPGKASVNKIIVATSNFWSRLGNVTWLADQGELEYLEEIGGDVGPLEAFRADGELIEINDMKVRVLQDQVRISFAGTDVRFQLPERNNRGREVGVVGLWNLGSTSKFAKSRTLGLLAVTRPSKGSAAWSSVSEIVSDKSCRYASCWTQRLTSSLCDDLEIAHLIEVREREIAGDLSPRTHAGTYVSQLRKDYAKCLNCHSAAVASWLNSRHAAALDTLVGVGRDKDVRCLPCHVNTFRETGSEIEIRGRNAGVTCGSCHQSSKPTVQTCTICHTKHTDPNQHYAAAFSDVCGKDSKSGPCIRD